MSVGWGSDAGPSKSCVQCRIRTSKEAVFAFYRERLLARWAEDTRADLRSSCSPTHFRHKYIRVDYTEVKQQATDQVANQNLVEIFYALVGGAW